MFYFSEQSVTIRRRFAEVSAAETKQTHILSNTAKHRRSPQKDLEKKKEDKEVKKAGKRKCQREGPKETKKQKEKEKTHFPLRGSAIRGVCV